jgi:hypothetical protein
MCGLYQPICTNHPPHKCVFVSITRDIIQLFGTMFGAMFGTNFRTHFSSHSTPPWLCHGQGLAAPSTSLCSIKLPAMMWVWMTDYNRWITVSGLL